MSLTATSTSVMSQDVIATADVLLDSSSVRPVSIFLNPANGLPEAFGIVAPTSTASRMIGHVTRDAATDAGWSVHAVGGGIADAVEVAAGTVNGVAFGVYSDAASTWVTQLQTDGTWSSPQSMTPLPISNLRTAYTPDQRLVVYGVDTAGNLVMFVQEVAGEPLTAYTRDLGGALANGVEFSFVLTSHADWSLVANINGAAQMWTSQIGSGTAQSSAITLASGATLAHLITGYWSDANQALMFFYTDTNHQLYLWWSAGGTTSNIPFNGSVVTTSAVHVSLDRSIHLYTLDDRANLSVLHQDPLHPWNGDGSPNFVPFIGLDTNIGSVVCDTNPAHAPTLFAIDATDQSLRLHAQDPQTNMWTSGKLLQSAQETYEVVRFRTEVVLTDENNIPMPNHPVTLTAAPNSSTSFVSCRGRSYVVDSAGCAMTTDVMGKLTFATLVNSKMVAPDVVFSADSLATPLTISPSRPVHEYLSGSATPLNPTNPGGPLPQFDAGGNALGNATTPDGQKVVKTQATALLPIAASAIQQVAKSGLGTQNSDVVGFAFNLRGGTPNVQVFTSKEEFDAHVAMLKGPELESLWSDISHFAGDVYHAVSNGFLAIEGAAISVAEGIATFTTEVANGIKQAVSVVITSIEQAASIIAGVFRAILAEIEMIIEWLKALFDLRAIWNTKLAIDAAVAAIPGIVSSAVTLARTRADGWFSAQEQSLSAAIASAQQRFGTKTLGQQGGFTVTLPTIPGLSSVVDIINDVHHNWLLDKLLSAVPGSPDTSAIESAVENFVAAMGTDLANFLGSDLGTVGTWFTQVLDPENLAQMSIGGLLTMIDGVLQAVLRLADTVADSVLDLANAITTALSDFLASPLNLGFLTKIWDWITRHLTGGGGDFSVGTLVSLLLAFPATLAYKLINGASSEPFPDGKLPNVNEEAMTVRLGEEVPKGAILAAGIMQVLYGVGATISVIMQRDAPWWLTATLAVAAVTIWVFRHGIPDWVTVDKASIAFLGLPLLLFILRSTFLVGGLGQGDATRSGILVLASLYGLATFIIGLIEIPDVDAYEIVANLTIPLPSMASFLSTPPFAAVGGPDIHAVVTFGGFFLGGSFIIVDATS